MPSRPLHFALAVLVVLAAPAFAQTAFAPLANQIRSEPLFLPAETVVVSLTPADTATPRQAYTVRRTFGASGSFTVNWKTDRFELSQTFRPDGTLLTGRQSDRLRSTSVEQTTDARRTNVRTVVTEAGKEKSAKSAELKSAMALRDELQFLVPQAWLYGIRDGLKFQSLSPDGGLVGDFQIVFKLMADPTAVSDKYSYPAEFKAALGVRNSYLVADMTLQGVGALFYPHHFYLVYEVTASGLEWSGYFGEDPKKPVFQFRVKKG